MDASARQRSRAEPEVVVIVGADKAQTSRRRPRHDRDLPRPPRRDRLQPRAPLPGPAARRAQRPRPRAGRTSWPRPPRGASSPRCTAARCARARETAEIVGAALGLEPDRRRALRGDRHAATGPTALRRRRARRARAASPPTSARDPDFALPGRRVVRRAAASASSPALVDVSAARRPARAGRLPPRRRSACALAAAHGAAARPATTCDGPQRRAGGAVTRAGARRVFAVLVAATFAAFFVAQRLKNAPDASCSSSSRDPVFSPNGDGRLDRARCQLHAQEGRRRHRRRSSTATATRARRCVEDRRLRAVHASVRVRWDGRDDDGRRGARRRYRAADHAAPQGRSMRRAATSVRLDTTPPQPRGHCRSARARTTGPELLPDARRRARDDPLPGAGRQPRSRSAIFRTSPGPVASSCSTSERSPQGAGSGDWDGTRERPPRLPGTYLAVVAVARQAGNVGTSVPLDAPTGLPRLAYGDGCPAAAASPSATSASSRRSSPLAPAGRSTIGVDARGAAVQLDRAPRRRAAPRRRSRPRQHGGPRAPRTRRAASRASSSSTARTGDARRARRRVAGRRPPSRTACSSCCPSMTWQGRNAVDDDGDGAAQHARPRRSGARSCASSPATGCPPGFAEQRGAAARAGWTASGQRYDITTDVGAGRRARARSSRATAASCSPGDARWLPPGVAPRLRAFVAAAGRSSSIGTDSLRRAGRAGRQAGAWPSRRRAAADRPVRRAHRPARAQAATDSILFADDELELFAGRRGLPRRRRLGGDRARRPSADLRLQRRDRRRRRGRHRRRALRQGPGHPHRPSRLRRRASTTDRHQRADGPDVDAPLPLILAALLAAGAVLLPGARWRAWRRSARSSSRRRCCSPTSGTPSRCARCATTRRSRSPAIVGGVVALAALALLFDRRPAAFPIAAVGGDAVPRADRSGGSTANLLVPLYLVVGAGALAYAIPRICGDEARGCAGAHEATALELAAGAARVVLYAVQASYSDDFDKALENVVFFYVPFALLFALLARVTWTRRLAVRVLGVLAALALAFAAVGFVEYATRHLFLNPKVIASNQFETYFRVNSLFFDPNIYGRFLAIVMLGVAAVLLWARARARRLGLGAAVLAVLWAGLVLTLSQSSFAALLVGLAGARRARAGARAGRSASAPRRWSSARSSCSSRRRRCGWTSTPRSRPTARPAGAMTWSRAASSLFADKPLQGYGIGRVLAGLPARREGLGREGGVGVAHDPGDRRRRAGRAGLLRLPRAAGRRRSLTLFARRARRSRRAPAVAAAFAALVCTLELRGVPRGPADVGAARAPALALAPRRAARRHRAPRSCGAPHRAARRRRAGVVAVASGRSSRPIRTTTPTTTWSGAARSSTATCRPSRPTRRRPSTRSTWRLRACSACFGEHADRLLVLFTASATSRSPRPSTGSGARDLGPQAGRRGGAAAPARRSRCCSTRRAPTSTSRSSRSCCGRRRWRRSARARGPRRRACCSSSPACCAPRRGCSAALLAVAAAARRCGLLALAAAAPLIWCAVDVVVTGDPLFALHSTSDLADELDRTRGSPRSPATSSRSSSTPRACRSSLAAAARARPGVVAARRLRALHVPLALFLAGTLTFFGDRSPGLSVLPRYLTVPAVALCLPAGYAVAVRRALRRCALRGRVAVVAARLAFVVDPRRRVRQARHRAALHPLHPRRPRAVLDDPAVRAAALRPGHAAQLPARARHALDPRRRQKQVGSRAPCSAQGVALLLVGEKLLRRYGFADGARRRPTRRRRLPARRRAAASRRTSGVPQVMNSARSPRARRSAARRVGATA